MRLPEVVALKNLRAQFGRRLRALRLARRLTQEELAERSGLSYKFIGEMERGVANPTLDTLLGVSGGLEITLAALVSEIEDAQISALDFYPVSRRDIQVVREALESLDDAFHRISQPASSTRGRRKRQPRQRRAVSTEKQ